MYSTTTGSSVTTKMNVFIYIPSDKCCRVTERLLYTMWTMGLVTKVDVLRTGSFLRLRSILD